jgi:LPXTG-motif cell wall-anchored protein
MKKNKSKALLLGFVLISNMSYAHINPNNHHGMLANFISLGIVLISILIFFIVRKRRKNK